MINDIGAGSVQKTACRCISPYVSAKKKYHKILVLTNVFKVTMCIILITASSLTARERKWKVGNVEFIGNKTFKRSILLSRIELKPPILFSSTLFTEYKVRSDINALEGFYQSQGFLNAVIDRKAVVRDSSRYRVSLSFNIDEGKVFLIKALEIQSATILIDSTFIKKLQTQPGQPLVTSSIESDTRLIKELLAEQGYLVANVRPDVQIDSLDHSAKVTIIVFEGPVVYVDSIIIKGNEGLRQKIVERELNFDIDEKLTISKIRKTERKLYRTDHFSYVKVTPMVSNYIAIQEESADTSVPVTIDVDEADFFKIETGAGYGTANGFRGSLTTGYGNLFRLGHKLSLIGNLSQKQQEIMSRYSIPWFMALPLKYDVAIYMKNQTDEKNTFDALFRGLELTAGQQTDFYFAYRIWAKWEDVSMLSGNTNVKNTQSIGTDLVWDTRTNLKNPTSGMYHQLQIQTAGLTDKRSSEFIKITTDSRLYWTLGKMRNASAIRLGWSNTFGTTDSLPLQERFYGGGSRTVRGFDESGLRRGSVLDSNGNSTGKTINLSGTTSLIANIFEIKFPIIWWLEGALFADAGYIWIRENGELPKFTSFLNDIRWTVGTGLRLNTPIAVIRLDAGFKIDKRPKEHRGKLYFDIGSSF